MQRVLLVEDSLECQVLVHRTLENNFEVTCASRMEEAIHQLQKKPFDLVLVDVGLPDGDGFGFCTQLRDNPKTQDIPVVFLTAKSELNDKMRGFSAGGDDYIVKPFEPLELRARVNARLNRSKTAEKTADMITKGELRLNVPYQKAYLMVADKKTELDLTPIEFRLLYHFVTHEGIVLSREHLLKNIWGEQVNVVDRTIDKHISSLRRKLGKCANYIDSIYSVGYVFSVQGMRGIS